MATACARVRGTLARESLEFQLFSEEPVYDDFEQLKLASSLEMLAEQFGADDPLVKTVLHGKSPREHAADLVLGTKIKDVATRKKLYHDGTAALKDFEDPMIDLARAIDPASRAERKILEEQDELKQQAYRQIAEALTSPSREPAAIPTPPSPSASPMAWSKAIRKTGKFGPGLDENPRPLRKAAAQNNKLPC